MERVMGTISDGDRVIARDLPILMVEAQTPGDHSGWGGQFDLPPEAIAPRMQRFYRLQTGDGRTGQIIFVGTSGTGSHRPIRLRFRTAGPLD